MRRVFAARRHGLRDLAADPAGVTVPLHHPAVGRHQALFGRSSRPGRVPLQTAVRDGSTNVILGPLDFMARMAALVPSTRATAEPDPPAQGVPLLAESRDWHLTVSGLRRFRFAARSGNGSGPRSRKCEFSFRPGAESGGNRVLITSYI